MPAAPEMCADGSAAEQWRHLQISFFFFFFLADLWRVYLPVRNANRMISDSDGAEQFKMKPLKYDEALPADDKSSPPLSQRSHSRSVTAATRGENL